MTEGAATSSRSGIGRGRYLLLCAAIAVGTTATIAAIAAGCSLRTDAPSLAEVSGISTEEILDQFAVESTPPSRGNDGSSTSKPAARISHPDPIDLRVLPLRFATTAPGSPLIEALSTAFKDDGYRGSIEDRQVAPGVALEDLCSGRVDLVQIARSPRPDEEERCNDAGIELAILPVAFDRIVLVAHPDNFWFGKVSSNEIGAILSAESWNDVNEQWPRRALSKYLPVPDSAEMDAVATAAWLAGSQDVNIANLARTTYQNDVVDRLGALAADPEGIAFVPMGDLRSSAVDFVVRPVDVDDPLVAEEYPIERTIRLVFSQDALEQSPELASFVSYYLNHVELVAPSFNLASPAALGQTRRDFVARSAQLLDDADQPVLLIEGEL